MSGGEAGPDTPLLGRWVVSAPELNADGRPLRHRAPYPESPLTPARPGFGASAPTGGLGVPGNGQAAQPVAEPQATSVAPAGPAAEKAPEHGASAAGESTRPSTGQRVRSWAETIGVFALGLVLALVVRAFLLQAFSIPSDSMVPTLEQGDRVVVWKPSDTIDDLSRGDVIVFKRPDVAECPFANDDPADLIKRVIGLPGEEITSPDGDVFVDGKPIDESYLPPGTRTDMSEPITVPDGQVLMLGDNRGASKDGRCFGPIEEDEIVGRATNRVWPPGRIGGL